MNISQRVRKLSQLIIRKPVSRVTCLGMLALGFTGIAFAQLNLSGARVRPITIHHGFVGQVNGTNQTDFPVLISGTYSFLATTANGGGVLNANGYDIVFTSDPFGQNLLDFEIDNYNPTTGAAGFWVRIPTLSHTADTTIYMFYGIPGVTTSQENKTGVWRNNYLSVYHFGNGNSVSLSDSGSAGYNLSASGTPTAVPGPIAGGVSFSGDPATFLAAESVSAYPTGDPAVTLETWVKFADSSSGVDVLGYGSNNANGARFALDGGPGNLVGVDSLYMGSSGPQPGDGNWHHLVATYSGGVISASTEQVYLDGQALSLTIYGGTPAITTTEFKIGGIPTVNYCCAFDGAVDEVRISSVARSADWVATEYANQSSPSTFYSMGSAAAGPQRLAITIHHNLVGQVNGTDQTDFPLLIQNPSSSLATTANGGSVLNANGYDIIFTSDAGGQNLLDFEIDTYNPSTGAANFWVRIPTLSHSADTTIYMFYGIPGITTSQENKAGVWRNNYLSVYHLGNGSTVGVADSGSANYALSISGSPAAASGQIGGGVQFSGDASAFLSAASVAAYPRGQSPVTIEAWAKESSPQNPNLGGGEVVGYGDNSANGDRIGLQLSSNVWYMEFLFESVSAPLTPDTNWHHFVGVYGGGALNTSTSQIYLDGTPEGTAATGGPPNITSAELKIGGIPTVTGCCAFNGSVDEVRVSSVARSADWVATEYANQSSPSTFYSISSSGGGDGNGVISFTCSPVAFYQGGNTTCFVPLKSGATGTVTFSLDGTPITTATPDSLGLANALIDLASASVGNHTVGYSYPGDSSNPAASGSTTITVEPAGTAFGTPVYQYGITSFAPNGNVLAYFDSVNGQWSNIQYDGLNRLIGAQVSPPITGFQSINFCWGYDSFGNRTSAVQSNHAISGDGMYCTPQVSGTPAPIWTGLNTLHTSANQISDTVDPVSGTHYGSPVSYDPNGGGGVSQDGQTGGTPHYYLYDAEGRICAVQYPSSVPGMPNQMTQYLYDADGNRIGKGTITTWNCDADSNGFTLTNEYVLDQGGDQVTELDGSGNWVHTNAYVGGSLIATYDTVNGATYDSPTIHYQFADWLGTRRMQVSPSGQLEESCQSLPFGDQLNCSPNNTVATADDATEHHFTGKERDTESGNDYFGARYYESSIGRWISPDWSTSPTFVPYASLPYPQSLNLYSYVQDNPLSRADLDGHHWWNKLGNLFSEANCWCEGPEAAASAARNRARDARDARDYQDFLNSPEGHVFVTITNVVALGTGAATSAAADPITDAGTDAEVEGAAAGGSGAAGVLDNANFAQTTYSQSFSSGGAFAGQTVDQVAAALRSGSLSPEDVPIEYISKDGNTLILNTRSAQALEQAGIPRSQWSAVDVTGDPSAEARVAAQLQRNGLTSAGTPSVTEGR